MSGACTPRGTRFLMPFVPAMPRFRASRPTGYPNPSECTAIALRCRLTHSLGKTRQSGKSSVIA